jgi:catechol O-methyltransferase
MQETLEYVIANAEMGNPRSVLETIDQHALDSGKFLMNVGPEKGKILKKYLIKYSPQSILEFGSFIGYSAILIAMNTDSKAYLYSVDPDKNSIAISKQMLNFSGLINKVSFVNLTAEEAIQTFKDPFDFVFVDHVKKRYFSDLILLEKSKLLRPGSVVFADNVGIFADEMEEYFKHVRNPKLYSSENIGSHLEYRDNIYDAVEISIMK